MKKYILLTLAASILVVGCTKNLSEKTDSIAAEITFTADTDNSFDA